VSTVLLVDNVRSFLQAQVCMVWHWWRWVWWWLNCWRTQTL